jgi:hypothetical protein
LDTEESVGWLIQIRWTNDRVKVKKKDLKTGKNKMKKQKQKFAETETG